MIGGKGAATGFFFTADGGNDDASFTTRIDAGLGADADADADADAGASVKGTGDGSLTVLLAFLCACTVASLVIGTDLSNASSSSISLADCDGWRRFRVCAYGLANRSGDGCASKLVSKIVRKADAVWLT